MAKVIFTGWRQGLRKIPLAKLLRDQTSISLLKAKHIVDRILDGDVQVIQLADREKAIEICVQATNFGAICEVAEE